MNFRGSNQSVIPVDKMNHKKEFYDSNTIQSIKSELLSNNTTLSASSKAYSGQDQNFVNSYEEDDFNNDNIDVETDSDNDQQITELKQMSYHNLSDATVKHEEWSKIVKSSMMKSVSKSASVNEPLSPFSQDDPTDPHDKKVKIDGDPDLEKCADESRTTLKRVFLPNENESEYFSETFTSHNLLNLSEKKRGKYGNGKGFSIENLIGRMVEDR